MKQLFDKISVTNKQLQGWCGESKAIVLASMVLALQPDTVLEIGVFGGKSLIPMALAMKEINRGVVIGVDAWSKQVAVREQTSQEHRDWWDKLDIENIYHGFMQQLDILDLHKHVEVVRKQSQDFNPPQAVSILHVDGSHGITTINDIMRFAPKVVIGGLVIIDDLRGDHGAAPSMAANRLLQMRFKRLYELQDGAVFQRQ